VLDMDNRTLRFSMDKFADELEEALLRFDDPTYFDVSETYSAVYHRFLNLDQFFAQVDRPRGMHLCGNPDKELTVEQAFAAVNSMADALKEKYA